MKKPLKASPAEEVKPAKPRSVHADNSRGPLAPGVTYMRRDRQGPVQKLRVSTPSVLVSRNDERSGIFHFSASENGRVILPEPGQTLLVLSELKKVGAKAEAFEPKPAHLHPNLDVKVIDKAHPSKLALNQSMLVLEGRGWVHLDGKMTRFIEGDAFFIAANDGYSIEPDKGTRIAIAVLSNDGKSG